MKWSLVDYYCHEDETYVMYAHTHIHHTHAFTQHTDLGAGGQSICTSTKWGIGLAGAPRKI